MLESPIQAEWLMLGDIYLITNKEWDAIINIQEKVFKENPIGHEAKYRRAKVSIFKVVSWGKPNWTY